MQYRIFKPGALALALWSLAGAAQGQSQTETIYVSATRAESPALPVAAPIVVIDRDQIRASGATQVSEVLRAQAGIQLLDSDGSGTRNTTVSMRGFSGNAANNTLVLVDGRRLNNPTLAGPALNTVALQDVERIEIVQGSAGVLYGDQAVGGVINIITRQVRGQEAYGSLDVTRSSFDTASYRLSLNEGYSNGVTVRLNGEKRYTDNYRDNHDQNTENLVASLGYRFDGGHLLIERQWVNDSLRLPGPLTDEAAAENRRQSSTPEDYSDQKTRLTRLAGQWRLAPGWRFLMDYSHRDEEVQGQVSVPLTQVTEVNSYSPRLVNRYRAPNGIATWTLGYDRTDADYARYSEWGDVRAEQTIDAYYSHVIYPLTETLNLTAGLRRSQVDDRQPDSGAEYEQRVTAKDIGLSYQLTGNVRLFGRRADGFRFANVDENAWTLPDVDRLDVQTSRSHEVGAAWRGRLGEWQTAFYDMTIDNELAYDGQQTANVNLPESDRRGAVLDGRYPISDAWDLSLNYTYTDAAVAAGDYAGNDQPWVAANTGNLALAYRSGDFTWYVDTRYTGSRYRLGDEANAEGKVAGHTLFGTHFIWVDDGWEFGFRVDNLTDREVAGYRETYAPGMNVQYPSPGRRYEARLSLSF
ncbi:TonB-dependent receptor domain-containing protein [Marinimicrobium alkaliphilum]|uniref:TonB-dependent receptor domain-containing protein n=1 Tax=Marinimicrobium alkaliphilum TaxID=2202654 RepID=UPI000DB988BE|nr:TonB-dependent receptor [Marinimicrobium alkaliphilum]